MKQSVKKVMRKKRSNWERKEQGEEKKANRQNCTWTELQKNL